MKAITLRYIAGLFLGVLLAGGINTAGQAQVKLNAQADGYVYLAGKNMNIHFGSGETLIAHYTRKPETTAQTYVRFDLSSQPKYFKDVQFHIYGKANSSRLVDVYAAYGQWTDTSLNGGAGGKPSRVSFLGSIEITTEEKYYQLNITPYINYMRAAGKTDITLVIAEREQQNDAGLLQFNARENKSGKSAFLSLEAGRGKYTTHNSTYYIDAEGGSDMANGKTPQTAWKTLRKLESVFLQQGDQILFKRGNIFRGSIFLKIIPGATQITRIDAYGEGERPVLDAEGRESFVLMLFNTPYVEVANLSITQSAGDVPSIRRGIYYNAEDMGEVNHVYFLNLNVHNIVGNKGKDDGDLYAKRNAGLSLEITGNNTPTFMNGYRIEGCRFFRVGRHGAVNQSTWSTRTLNSNTNWVPSRSVVIRKNVFEETASDGLIVRVADGPLMEYNLFKRCSIELSGNACFSFNCDNAVWQYNEACYTVYNTGDADAAGFDSDYKSRNTLFQFNYAHHNEYGDMLITGGPASSGGFNDGTIVRYNVFYNNGHHGLRLSGLASNSYIYNNVIYKDQGIARPTEPYQEYPSNRLFYTKNWGGWPANTFYANNIYYYFHDSMPASTDLNADKSFGSVLYSNIVYANRIINQPGQQGGISLDPLIKLPQNKTSWDGLENMLYFQVGPSSPAIAAGIKINNSVPADFKGTSVPQNGRTDIGAFEYKSK